MANRLHFDGGFPQQDRMILEKRRSLDYATKYSYQAAKVRIGQGRVYRALINPDKVKQDYDDKIISIEKESGYKCGDVFYWLNTGTYWLIYLQELSELAYFRAEIRRCDYEIEWDGGSTRAAVRGPMETKIDSAQKHGIIVDSPNYSLNILMPKNEDTYKQFKRYSKFYLQVNEDYEDPICWRVEAVDAFSMPGVIEVNAVEYYMNEVEDDIENGLVGKFIAKPIDPNEGEDVSKLIEGNIFIKPKRTEKYVYTGESDSKWIVPKNCPVDYVIDGKEITLKWRSSYSGQFDLSYGEATKTIVVESLY